MKRPEAMWGQISFLITMQLLPALRLLYCPERLKGLIMPFFALSVMVLLMKC